MAGYVPGGSIDRRAAQGAAFRPRAVVGGAVGRLAEMHNPSPAAGSLLTRRIPATVLFGLPIGWLAYDLLLLCRFIGLNHPALHAGWAVLTAGLFWLATLPRRREMDDGPTVATLLACLGIAALLMLLGGEGRFFYANPDWQVRDAVLRDMRIHPWPFVYASGDMLRAPIGMYLLPALAGKAFGQTGADLALLGQNSLLLGTLLALGSTLFASLPRRLIALTVFLAFSGLDVLGQLKVGHAPVPTAHLEGWGPTQFSSTITLAFWVPPHAIAGWFGALGFLLWRVERLGLGKLLMLPPLTALWSPLAAMGLMPFVAYACWHDLRRGRITLADIALPALATAIALPALLYMAAAGEQVGARFFPIHPAHYLLFETLEALPYLLIAWAGWRARFGGPVLAIVALMLLAAPLIQVGWWIDFAMRATIPALAILALHLGDMLGVGGGWVASKRRKAALIALLAIGSLTGLTEIARALTLPASPAPRCGFARAWDESFAAWPKASYLAPLAAMPPAIRPTAPARVIAPDPARCYDRPWPKPPLF